MKKKIYLVISLLFIGSFALSACNLPFVNVVRGSGDLTIENREVSGFDSVQLDGAGRLVITQGESESLEIEAEDNIINELTSEVRGDTLVLGFREQSWRRSIIPTRGITYTLSLIDLTEITFNGAGNIEMDSLETPTLDLTISGAGQVTIDALQADSLSVTIAGTGTIRMAGQVSSQTISIDGAGNYEAGDLETSSTKIDINGLGNGTVWATESLDITINGGGRLDYFGTPNVTQDINGLGDINNRGEK